MTDGPSATLKPTLAFTGEGGLRVGEERFALLQAIEDFGSISAAAKAVGLSYRAAWDAVNALNNLFPKPLVVKHPGGKHGGGALVSAEGRHALAAHRRLSEGLASVMAQFQDFLAEGPVPDTSSTPLFWSLIMKTSARNTYHGVVSGVTTGAVNAEVLLRIADDIELTAIITNQSVVKLGLEPGREAFALIKASTPILMSEAEGVRTSARNRICGVVSAVERGAVNADVVLDIGEGKTLSAIVTEGSVDALDIKPGDRMCALIKASQIILGVN